MSRRLEGKVALITGAASGQGAEEARLFAMEGARVVLTDILKKEGEAIARRLATQDGRVLFLEHDVGDEQRWSEVAAKTVEVFGRLDILVNNAGIGAQASLDQMTLGQWEQMIRTNATSVFLGVKHCTPHLRKAGGGSIVNISSVGAMVASIDVAYAASKGAVRSMTKSLAAYLACDRIRVNSVHPGLIDTPLLARARKKGDLGQLVQNIPLKRLGQPIDMAQVVLFLASDESSYITGAEFVVDGGSLIRPLMPMVRP